MFEVILYEDSAGKSQVAEFVTSLKNRNDEGKNARTSYRKTIAYVRLLAENGTMTGMPVMRYLQDGIWELRPLVYRILFAFVGENRYLLLHSFRKTTKRTPKREIEKAKRELEDFLVRERKNENMGRI